MRAVAALHARIAPSSPLWRAFVVIRTVQRWIGWTGLRRLVFHGLRRRALRRLA